MSQVMVVYNAETTDAWCGAWIMDRCFNGTQMIASRDNEEPPIVDNRTVFFVGLCYSAAKMQEIQTYSHRAIMVDHRKSSRSIYRKHDNCIYDSSASSSKLAYDWCCYRGYVDNFAGSGWKNNRDIAKGMDAITKYVEDAELGRWRLPNSKYISLCIESYDRDLRQWDMIARRASVTPDALTNDGIAIDRYLNRNNNDTSVEDQGQPV